MGTFTFLILLCTPVEGRRVLLRTAAAIIIINLIGNRISNKHTTAIMSSSKHPEEEEQEVAEEEEAEAKIEIEVRAVLMAMGRPIKTKINILITKTTNGICQRVKVEEGGKSIKARPQLAKPMLSRRAPHKSTIFRKQIRTKKQKQGLHSQTSLNTRSTRPSLI